MFGALFAKYWLDIWLHLLEQVFPEGQNSNFFSALPNTFILRLSNYFFGVFCYKLSSWQSLIDIIFGYPLIRQFDTIWQA